MSPPTSQRRDLQSIKASERGGRALICEKGALFILREAAAKTSSAGLGSAIGEHGFRWSALVFEKNVDRMLGYLVWSLLQRLHHLLAVMSLDASQASNSLAL